MEKSTGRSSCLAAIELKKRREMKERELQLREKEQELARRKEEGASEERKMLLKFPMENTKK